MDGKAIASEIKAEISREVSAMTAPPSLAVVIVGDDPASKIYVGNKRKACAETGIKSLLYELPEDTPQKDLLGLIEALNASPEVSGILVQLPLPGHISEPDVLTAISPDKDVDGFHPANAGRLMIGQAKFPPCTPAGIVELIKRSGVTISGKRAVVVGRSVNVGKPAALMLLAENATVTVCHSRTRDLADVTREADILVVALGKPRFITADMVKPGAAVIDVGIHRLGGGKLCGDVDFEAVREVAGDISPVPGGVGLMTVAMLMKNTLAAARL
ncbi:MAG: bifunctional methylenetetrahydrofolate dehydrogenase/methenyltetrahydrofolate cyclohydrolase FolD [Clostridiales bacterium]|jgi:methylenetetrahydrofolate dehydrogenase (NADP+)/methenyltetrahydrofolate cyclohydrolase|nr:bifunctional methylenetetrahydrofolate dehydrogenase/methenyltetrahydrofolate cyclohydrolase FolD [Clostridiales bacterium]